MTQMASTPLPARPPHRRGVRRVRPWVAALLPATAATLFAATQVPTTAPFTVSANVVRGCQVSGAPSQTSGIDLGTLDFGMHPATRLGTVDVMAASASQALIQCTPGTTLRVAADGGQHAIGVQRYLSNGTQLIPYNLTLVSSIPIVLLPGPTPTLASMTLDATPTRLPILGSATLPGTGLTAGTYKDTVIVTLTW